jgi:hypothetical protein
MTGESPMEMRTNFLGSLLATENILLRPMTELIRKEAHPEGKILRLFPGELTARIGVGVFVCCLKYHRFFREQAFPQPH